FAQCGWRSTPIIGVDRDIVVRQITGPDGGSPTSNADIYPDGDFRILHIVGADRLRILGSALAVAGNHVRPEPNGQSVTVSGLARFADGHHHAAPVGVLAGDGGL